MADNLQKRPSKGILKNSSSFDKQDSVPASKKSKETKWDEMNIIATLHPPDKDYGHMKIDEPKTPYNYVNPEEGGADVLDAAELAEKIRLGTDRPPKVMERIDDGDEESEDSDAEMTEEQREQRNEFESKRKKHYNEYYAIKLARKLIEEEDDTDEEGEGKKEKAGTSSRSKSTSPMPAPKSPTPPKCNCSDKSDLPSQ